MCPALKAHAHGTLRTRPWSDPQVSTHLALLPGIAVALVRDPPMLELAMLQSIVCVLSIIWHRSHERECGLAKVEHAFAHALFVYGAVQTWYSPSAAILCMHLLCACVTLSVYVATNRRPDLWETWHPVGLHVVPGLWSLVIACYHRSLFDVWDLRVYFI
jgi:hypothetical protein